MSKNAKLSSHQINVKQNPTLPFSKQNFYMLEQERNMLKITLDFLSEENSKLKSQIEDMKTTVRHNKEQLEEYVTKITNKDKVFEKMKNQIEQLTTRLRVLESLYKKKNNKKTSNNNLNASINSHNNSKTDNKLNLNQSTTNVTSILNSSVIVTKDDKHLYSNKKHDEQIKEFFAKQSELLEEVSVLKDDIQFLLENKSKKKLKENLDMSMSSNRSGYSSNSSYISSNNSHRSDLNSSFQSIVSNTGNKQRTQFNLRDRFNFDKNFTEFLYTYNPSKNILILIDNSGDMWELVKRNDLNKEYVKQNPDCVKSILQSYKGNEDKLIYDKLLKEDKSEENININNSNNNIKP